MATKIVPSSFMHWGNLNIVQKKRQERIFLKQATRDRKLRNFEYEIVASESIKEYEKIFIACARETFKPGVKQPCAVCGKYQALTQAHHVVPLAVQLRDRFRMPYQAFEWLCPTHHIAVHLFIDQTKVQNVRSAKGYDCRATRGIINVTGCLVDLGEFEAVFSLWERAYSEGRDELSKTHNPSLTQCKTTTK
jgi:hypothetical protein